jgi:hypothetical protein
MALTTRGAPDPFPGDTGRMPGEDPALISFHSEALRSPGVIERTRRVMATATAP